MKLKIYGCDHCGGIFQSKSIYGFEPRYCTSCGASSIQVISKEDLKVMLNSSQVLPDVKNNISEMMALMPKEEKKEL